MKRLLILALALPLMAGCKPASTNPPTAPVLQQGAYNSADQTIYDALRAAQGALNSLVGKLNDSSVDAATKANLKPYVNKAIADYNIAMVAWKAYHAALATNPQTSPAEAQNALSRVQTDLSTTPKVTQ